MVLTALAAVPLARSTLGWTADDTRARVHDDIRSRVASLGAALDAAAVGLTRDAAQVEAGATGLADAVRALFDRVGALQTSVSQVTAVTIYDADGVPLAWEGRPATLPASRLAGGSATFLVPTPLGLRLARLEPIAGSEATRRRAGVVVAEAALSTAAGPSQSVSAVEVQTPLAPVLLWAERRRVVRPGGGRARRPGRHDPRDGPRRARRYRRGPGRAGGAGWRPCCG